MTIQIDFKLLNLLKLNQIRNLFKISPEKIKSKDTYWKNRKEIFKKSSDTNVGKKSLSTEPESQGAFKKKLCLL